MIIHLHVNSGDDSLNGIAVVGQTIFVKLAVAAILFFWNCWKSIPAKLMPPYIRIKSLVMIYSWLFLSLIRRCKILFFSEIVENQYQPFCSSEIVNTSQAYATLYPYKTFGEDIFITFPLIDRTSSIFWVSKKLAVAAILFLKKCWKSIPAKLLTP